MKDQDQETRIAFEADREELISIINELTPGFITKKHVDAIIRALPKAKATLLQRSIVREDGDRRMEIFGDEIIHVVRKEASVGSGLAEGIKIPAHLNVYMKAHSGLLNEIEEALGMECKNG